MTYLREGASSGRGPVDLVAGISVVCLGIVEWVVVVDRVLPVLVWTAGPLNVHDGLVRRRRVEQQIGGVGRATEPRKQLLVGDAIGNEGSRNLEARGQRIGSREL